MQYTHAASELQGDWIGPDTKLHGQQDVSNDIITINRRAGNTSRHATS
jgi:hypothetical protein